MSLFNTIISTVLIGVAVVASPITRPQSLIVYSPRITAPTEAFAWTVGSAQTVSWDASNVPAEKKNSTGLLLLGYDDENGENLDIKNPLASDFPITAGRIQITVPQVDCRDNYIVVLFGDSGNASPQFKICTKN